MLFIGIDTGGTFTDFVLFDGECFRVHKVLSTPNAPEQAILKGIRDLGLDAADLQVVHGSTVATNAVLEGKGVRTAYITHQGLADVLTIGRQVRDELYELQPPIVEPPVPRELCLEAGGRIAADGSELEPLTAEGLAQLCGQIEALAPEAVAINLLFSYLDDSHEQAIAAAMPKKLFVACSSEVLPIAGEYERGIATWLNAWVGPLVEGYLRRLSEALPVANIAVMQSSGEAIAAKLAVNQAVRLLLSGPAGGLVGARYTAGLSGQTQLLTFDMGGTSTDVALIDGEAQLTTEGRIGRYPVAVPMVDMHTIGAGGGSIAWLDSGGMLQVGPESAGADPGPACYGLGGTKATVTDANLILGRLRPEAFLGGQMPLDVNAATQALSVLAEAMACSIQQAAEGIVQIANEHMARALRVISVQRGVDPRDHVLVSFGGAGGLHVCALAESLGMTRCLVPMHAGVLSALGMLATQPGRQLFRAAPSLVSGTSDEAVKAGLDELAAGGYQSLQAEGVAEKSISSAYSLDMRYRGQSYTLNVPWSGALLECVEAFGVQHERRYGHRMNLPVELVNLRVALRGQGVDLSGVQPDGGGKSHSALADVSEFSAQGIKVICRDHLRQDEIYAGPAIITETAATTWLAEGWACRVDKVGNLQLSLLQ